MPATAFNVSMSSIARLLSARGLVLDGGFDNVDQGNLWSPNGGWGVGWTIFEDRGISLTVLDDKGLAVEDTRIEGDGSMDILVGKRIMASRLARALDSLLWTTRETRKRLEDAKRVPMFAARLRRLAEAYHLDKLTYEEHTAANRVVWAEAEAAGLGRQVAAAVAGVS